MSEQTVGRFYFAAVAESSQRGDVFNPSHLSAQVNISSFISTLEFNRVIRRSLFCQVTEVTFVKNKKKTAWPET